MAAQHKLVSDTNLKTSREISGLGFLILFQVSFHIEKKILEISRSWEKDLGMLKLCGTKRKGKRNGNWVPQGCWHTAAFGAGSLRVVGGRIRFWGQVRMLCAECKLLFGYQSSFLLLSVLCTKAKKSVMSLAVFLGLSMTTECPQFSRSSTWQLLIDLASMSAPDTSSTYQDREGIRQHTKV